MGTYRNIAKLVKATEERVAPNLVVRRPLPAHDVDYIDPFLLLDHMGPRIIKAGEGGGVPDHPHRGFEPVTFLFEGVVEHKDSQGNHSKISGGDVQWMTAGSGIIHSEKIAREFTEKGGTFHGVQLWVNLPAKDKMTKPGYQNIRSETIPVVEKEGIAIRVIAGELFDKKGPAKTHSPVLALHIRMEDGSKAEIPVASDHNAFYYVLGGQVKLQDSEFAGSGELVLFEREQGGVGIEASAETEVLFLTGKPLNEPVVSYGPFVMNSQEEIGQAINDYRSGKMGRIDF
jgi:redox-sensitive bicupin YhaK (pirin superfamily)